MGRQMDLVLSLGDEGRLAHHALVRLVPCNTGLLF